MKRAYLASPLGFAESTRGFMRELEEQLDGVVTVENPWNNRAFDEAFAEAERVTDRAEYAARLWAINGGIARANEEAIRRCELLIAVLDGVDVDSGTAGEIGFAYGLDKLLFGLRTDWRLSGDNAGATVNLQVQYFIEASGGRIVTRVEDLLAALAEAGG